MTTDPTSPDGAGTGPARGPLSRRGLLAGLAGAAGLAVGAGGTQAVHALDGDGDPTPRPPSPGEELMTEHGVLKRLLLAYRAAADQLSAGQTPPVDAVVDAARVVYDYVESFHEGLEEAYVFPRVREAHPELVRTLLVQHDRGRHVTERIYRAADLDLTRPDARDRLRSWLGGFVRMYEPHEAWEDTVIYPALRRVTSQRELDLLAERFADLENTQYGDAALQQVLDRVTGIEDQLGIADLAAFTVAPDEI